MANLKMSKDVVSHKELLGNDAQLQREDELGFFIGLLFLMVAGLIAINYFLPLTWSLFEVLGKKLPQPPPELIILFK